MRAVVLKGGGLKLQERPEPVPGSDELLVKAEASGTNGADISHRTGNSPAPPGAPVDVPGLELAGAGDEPTAQARRCRT
jgi:NADPH:quinone reductase